ncbi:MAG TPA: hypothetical protein VMW43_02065 [Bacteroidota bacterium]|nr:hypothetical protein [Bacteroidota bacterium]
MKQLAILALVMVAVASLASAQPISGGLARELAMGGTQAGTGLVLNPFIMEDPSLLLVNPAYQVMYKDYAWMNIAGGGLTGASVGADGYGNQNAGAAFSVCENMNLGVILSYDPSLANNLVSMFTNYVNDRRGFTGSYPPQQIQNVWEVVGSWHMATMDLGLGVSYGSSNNEYQFTSTTPASSGDLQSTASVWGFRAGALINLGGSNTLDASALLHLDKVANKATTTPIATNNYGDYSASGTEFQFNARAKFVVSPKFNFVPYGIIFTSSASPSENTVASGLTGKADNITWSATAYALGVGGEYRVNSFFLAGGLSFQSAQQKTEDTPDGGTQSTYTQTYTAIPVVNLGMEWTILDWLTGRAGYERMIGSIDQKSETTTTTEEESYSFPQSWTGLGWINPGSWDGVVTLGVGMKFGNFAVDATVSDEALRRGLGLIGNQDNLNTFGYMTASYHFGQ